MPPPEPKDTPRRGSVVLVLFPHSDLRAAKTRPDLILLDMSLPGLDGWEVARRLKADPVTTAIPIIALAAHAMAGDRERALESGCDDYDTKPIELPRLLDKMSTLLTETAS